MTTIQEMADQTMTLTTICALALSNDPIMQGPYSHITVECHSLLADQQQEAATRLLEIQGHATADAARRLAQATDIAAAETTRRAMNPSEIQDVQALRQLLEEPDPEPVRLLRNDFSYNALQTAVTLRIQDLTRQVQQAAREVEDSQHFHQAAQTAIRAAHQGTQAAQLADSARHAAALRPHERQPQEDTTPAAARLKAMCHALASMGHSLLQASAQP